MIRLVAAMFALLTASTGVAEPVLRPHRYPFAGPATRVLVLGTPHLSQLPVPFRAEQLKPVLDRLAKWAPTIITIESLTGSDCEYLAANRTLTSDAWDNYCWDTKAAAAATGLTVAQATLAVEQRLKDWPTAPTAVDRRRLAALFLAANDRNSAQVQWLRLPPTERRAGDGLDAALVKLLERKGAKPNENVDLAAMLAARLGLERVYPTDDHSADAAVGLSPPAYGEATLEAWKSQAGSQARRAFEQQDAALRGGGTLLAYYRYLNGAEAQRGAIQVDFAANANEPSAQHWGRQYLGWWETRNLRMIANIRAASATHPGARVLSVVGASHKPYFEAYLSMLHDVRVEDTDPVLR